MDTGITRSGTILTGTIGTGTTSLPPILLSGGRLLALESLAAWVIRRGSAVLSQQKRINQGCAAPPLDHLELPAPEV
jgi:hypothetical protein